MNIITVDSTNIDAEHICCAIASKKSDTRAELKKDWLKQRFADGLVFKKLNVRGKVFIEYIPAEKAFAPITAPNYMYINCLWVSGKYKGQGHASRLLNECIKDAKAKGKSGLVALSSSKKKPFLSDPKFYKKKGFIVGDTASPYYELLYLPFKESKPPCFNDCVKKQQKIGSGVVVYYSNQCPHTEMYVNIIKEIAHKEHVRFTDVKLNTYEQAKICPNPFTTYAIFFNGKFETNEILTAKKFNQLLIKYNMTE